MKLKMKNEISIEEQKENMFFKELEKLTGIKESDIDVHSQSSFVEFWFGEKRKISLKRNYR